MWYLSYFFFQAEDGIRDWSVTGVQTCALPISEIHRAAIHFLPQPLVRQRVLADDDLPQSAGDVVAEGRVDDGFHHLGRRIGLRSEQRRVGKGVDRGGRGMIKKTSGRWKAMIW